MTALLLQQSALSPTALFEQQTAAAQPVSLQQGSQSFQTLSEQILATKLQIATLEQAFNSMEEKEEAGFYVARLCLFLKKSNKDHRSNSLILTVSW